LRLVDTREKIIETATRLFSLHGYSNTSLALVAKEVGVSKALILWHFDSKEDLFRTVLQRSLEPYTIDDQALQGLSEKEQVEKLIDDYYDFVSNNFYSVKFILGLVLRENEGSQDLIARVRELHHVYHNLLAAILERGRKKSSFVYSVDPALDAALIMATLNGLLLQRFVSEEKAPDPRVLLAHFKGSLWARLLRPGEAGPLKTGVIDTSRL
jgi:AcrR family transcriptional regulator